MGRIESVKIQKIRNVFFLVAYTLWILRAFFSTSFFYDVPLFVRFKEPALDVALCLCLVCIILDFTFNIKDILLVLLVCLCFWVSYSAGAVSFATSIVLIHGARYVPFRLIARWAVLLQGCLLAFVVACSQLGIIENSVFLQSDVRVRYGLGFLYCSYTSHYLLLFFMLYLVMRKRIRWYEVAGLLLLNGLGYAITDTKTDIISLVLMIVVTAVLRLVYHNRKLLRGLSYPAFIVPFFFCVISFWVVKLYTPEVPAWQKLDMLFNSRLRLSSQALQTYPIRLFGQKIKWVGSSSRMKDPSLVYNYVDNTYLTVVLQMGVLVAFFMCLLYGRAFYISLRHNQLALAAGLFVFMVIGLVNPEMRNLLYNTFVLVLLKPVEQFEGIESWKPRKERVKEYVG